MKKKMNILIIAIILLSFVIIGVVAGGIVLPKNLRYLIYFRHQINPPEDLYTPIVLDNFKFCKKGFSKTYDLKPKYYDIYTIGILCEKANITTKYKFKGRIRFEFFYNNKLLFNKIIEQMGSVWYLPNSGDSPKFKEIQLIDFEIPLLGKYKKNISVRVTVLEPDLYLKDKKIPGFILL